MVNYPVDTLTQLAPRCLGWPRKRVIGSGTVLDSARFRYMLSRHCGIDARNVHAYILGEHGDSKEHHREIARPVRDSAYHIIAYKGSTFYGIGLSLVRISGAIMRDEHSVLTVSTSLTGEYGIDHICLSVPCVVGARGIERIIDAPLASSERASLRASADALASLIEEVNARRSAPRQGQEGFAPHDEAGPASRLDDRRRLDRGGVRQPGES